MDLDKMSKDELVDLRKGVDKALATLETRKKAEARQAAEQAAKEFGFSLNELTGDAPKSKGAKGAPRYAHPENSSQTWTGKGRKPNWVNAWLENGKDLEDLAI